MKKYGGIIALVTAIVAVIVLATVLYNKLGSDYKSDNLADNSSSSQSEEKSKAPEFKVIDKDGNEVTLSEMRGKPVVVNFWASWCPPCKAEMPDFEDAYKKYGEDICFMMVNMTDGARETLAAAKVHINEQGYTFPVYFDTEFSAAVAYGVTSLPATYFIDSDGNFVTYAVGMIDYETLEKGISMVK